MSTRTLAIEAPRAAIEVLEAEADADAPPRKTKQCSTCLKHKPLAKTFFWRRSSGSFGYSNTCRQCHRNIKGRRLARQRRKTLDPTYVRNVLAHSMRISNKEVPALLVEVDRLRRMINRQLQKATKNEIRRATTR